MRVPCVPGGRKAYEASRSSPVILSVIEATSVLTGGVDANYKDQINRYLYTRKRFQQPPRRPSAGVPCYPKLGADGSIPGEDYVNNYVHRLLVMRSGLEVYENFPRMIRQAGRQICEVDLIGAVLRDLEFAADELVPLYDPELWAEVHKEALAILARNLSSKTIGGLEEIARGCASSMFDYDRVIKDYLPTFKGFQYIVRKLRSCGGEACKENADVDIPKLAQGPRPLLPDLSDCLHHLHSSNQRLTAEEEDRIELFRKERSALLEYDRWAMQNLPVEHPDHRYYAAVNALYKGRLDLLEDIAKPNQELVKFVHQAIGTARIEIGTRVLLQTLADGLERFDRQVKAIEDARLPKELLLFWKEWFLKKLGDRYVAHNVTREGASIDVPSTVFKRLNNQVEKDYYVNRVARVAREYSRFRGEDKLYKKNTASSYKDYIGQIKDPAAFAVWLLRHPEEIRVNDGNGNWIKASECETWTTADVPVELLKELEEDREQRDDRRTRLSGLSMWQTSFGRQYGECESGTTDFIEIEGPCTVISCPASFSHALSCPHTRVKELIPLEDYHRAGYKCGIGEDDDDDEVEEVIISRPNAQTVHRIIM